MASPYDIDQSSIVVLGRMQIGRMNPRELVQREILAGSEADATVVKVLIPNDLLVFETNFLTVTVEPNKLVVATNLSAPIPEKVRDFVISLFVEHEEPIIGMGINRDVHFRAADSKKYTDVRTKLVHLSPWANSLKNPRVTALAFQAERYDSELGHVNIRVEPSVQIPQGIFVQVNDHFDFRDNPEGSELAGRLPVLWSAAIVNAIPIIEVVRGFVL